MKNWEKREKEVQVGKFQGVQWFQHILRNH